MSANPVDFGAHAPSNSNANGGESAPFSLDSEPPEPSAPPRRAWSPADVVRQWREEGPLVHELTGNSKLDELTGGGPVYGSRWYWLGAPDAGKTAELVQIADVWARRGVAVGFLAVDEEPSDITTRLAQRAKFTRPECEAREPSVVAEMADALKDLPIRLYGPDWTIEAAAADLAKYAKEIGQAKLALFVDSIQQVACNATIASERELSARENVNANVRALRAVATEHRLIAMATSEMNRNAYRSIEAAEQANDMAAGKESGAIEFSARVMLSLRSVKGEKDLIAMRVVKNKHGPSGDESFRRIDRGCMAIEPAEAPAETDPDDARDARGKKQIAADAARLAALLLDFPAGLGVNRAREQLKVRHGSFSKDRVGPAMAKLGAGVVQRRGGAGKEAPMFLSGRDVPEDVVALLPLDARCRLGSAQPPIEVNE